MDRILTQIADPDDQQLVQRALDLLRIQKARIALTVDRTLDGKMKDDTPYHLRPAGEVSREAACKSYLFGRAQQVADIFEAFAGTGMAAGILLEAQPGARLSSVDLDPECVDAYNRRHQGSSATAVVGDASEFIQNWSPTGPWGATLDFNRFTLLDLTGRLNWKTALIDEVIIRRPDWIHITDSAAKYLHMNWRSYGLEDAEFLSYVRKLDWWINSLWGYSIVRSSRHSNACHTISVPGKLAGGFREVEAPTGLKFFEREQETDNGS